MREFIELRLRWPEAAMVFSPDSGDLLGNDVLRVVIRSDDPRLRELAELDIEARAKRRPLYFGWDITRRYSKDEIDCARAFRLIISAAFEPEGESCGTVYDTSVACPACGAGRKTVGPLHLDLSKLPQRKDIACSIAGDEWVVSQRLAEAMMEAGLSGVGLRPVAHRREDMHWESVALHKYNAGRELLRRAKDAGYDADSPYLWVWMRQESQRGLISRLYAEIDKRATQRRARRQFSPWYQLIATGNRMAIDRSRTRFGVRPINDDVSEAPPPRCGHVGGLNLLSEVWLCDETLGDLDFAVTDLNVGERRGVLVPSPLIVISQRFKQLLELRRVRGYRLEVAHFSRSLHS